MSEQTSLNRFAWALIGLTACAFALLSLLSFHVTDWPNPDVASSQQVANLCGRAGAFLAYHAKYYFGPTTIPVVLMLGFWLVMKALGKPVEQPILRGIGLLLLAAALAAAYHLYNPGTAQSLSHGNGGVLGIALGHFLKTYTAWWGAIIVLLAMVLVGLLLAADNIVLLLPGLLVAALERLRLAGPVLATISNRVTALAPKPRLTNRFIRPLTAAIPQREAAIREVAALEEETDDSEADEAELADSELFAQEEDSTRSNENKKQKAADFSLEAVSAVLTRMRGALAGPAHPAGVPEHDYQQYKYPPLELLANPVKGFSALQERLVRQKAKILEQTLHDFHIDASVVESETGPVITMFELQLAPGIKVAQISNLSNDLARSLGAAAVRIVAPIPGKHTIGVEVPNSEKEKVRIKELLQLAGDRPGKMQIPLFLGKDASGDPLITDLTQLPHVLIAGTTGSGKSVCINSIVVSILLTQRPDMVKLILVDPKMVELNAFRDIAHLMCPIITEMKKAEQILEWLTEKMDERYALLAEARVRNIAAFNKLTPEQIYERFAPSCDEEKEKIPLRLPFLVVIIDELADLMMTSAKETESYIIRLAQKSRAVGIHIVLATQRPQATVVTGLIKSNLPSRISFRVAARMDSRIVLDQNGAEALLGQGDMLFLKPGTSDLVRAQGAFISDREIHRIVKFLREVAHPHYHPELMQLHQAPADMEKDDLFDEAVKIVMKTHRGSVSLLQRRLGVPYARASQLIDQMAMAGIVGEYKGGQAREVLITPQEYQAIKAQMLRDEAAGYQDLQEDADEGVTSTAQDPAGSIPDPDRPDTTVVSIPKNDIIDDDMDDFEDDDADDEDYATDEAEDAVELDSEDDSKDQEEDDFAEDDADDEGEEYAEDDADDEGEEYDEEEQEDEEEELEEEDYEEGDEEEQAYEEAEEEDEEEEGDGEEEAYDEDEGEREG